MDDYDIAYVVGDIHGHLKQLLNIQNKTVILPRLDFQKVKNISGRLRTVLLVIPLMVLLLLGGGFYRWRIVKYGR